MGAAGSTDDPGLWTVTEGVVGPGAQQSVEQVPAMPGYLLFVTIMGLLAFAGYRLRSPGASV